MAPPPTRWLSLPCRAWAFVVRSGRGGVRHAASAGRWDLLAALFVHRGGSASQRAPHLSATRKRDAHLFERRRTAATGVAAVFRVGRGGHPTPCPAISRRWRAARRAS